MGGCGHRPTCMQPRPSVRNALKIDDLISKNLFKTRKKSPETLQDLCAIDHRESEVTAHKGRHGARYTSPLPGARRDVSRVAAAWRKQRRQGTSGSTADGTVVFNEKDLIPPQQFSYGVICKRSVSVPNIIKSFLL